MSMTPIRSGTFTPTKEGNDIEPGPYRVDAGHGLKSYDGHVRLERGRIHIDIFDSAELDNSKAHVESESFSSAKGANEFLEGYGFQVRVADPVKLRSKPKRRE